VLFRQMFIYWAFLMNVLISLTYLDLIIAVRLSYPSVVVSTVHKSIKEFLGFQWMVTTD